MQWHRRSMRAFASMGFHVNVEILTKWLQFLFPVFQFISWPWMGIAITCDEDMQLWMSAQIDWYNHNPLKRLGMSVLLLLFIYYASMSLICRVLTKDRRNQNPFKIIRWSENGPKFHNKKRKLYQTFSNKNNYPELPYTYETENIRESEKMHSKLLLA